MQKDRGKQINILKKFLLLCQEHSLLGNMGLHIGLHEFELFGDFFGGWEEISGIYTVCWKFYP